MSVDLKEVGEFYIMADKYGQMRITNYLDTNQLNPILQAVVNNGTVAIHIDTIATVFPKQFDAKMLKDNFDITPHTF